MKLKNYWKRFWTLDRHASAGFTLVELIVVIAILAILAGVGIPVYSGYITKANKQADMTLVGDVANALVVHYYSSNSKTGGFVTLSRDGVTVPAGERADDFGAAAMEAAFGEGWVNSTTLKYDWNADLAESSATTIGATQLVGSVSSLTGLASSVIAQNSPSNATSIIYALTGNNDALKAELEQYESDPEYATIATNLMVKHLSTELGELNPEDPNSSLSTTSTLALRYAQLYSMAHSSDPNASMALERVETFDAKMAELAQKEADGASDTSVMGELIAAMDALTMGDAEFVPAYSSYAAANGMTDLNGIIDAMGFVSSVAQGFSGTDLSNEGLYASDSVTNMLEDYQNANKYGIIVRIDANGVVTILPADANPAA